MEPASYFRNLRVSGYKNINVIADKFGLSIDDRLHACETLFGDLNAEIMILGQDAANAYTFERLICKEGVHGYRHGPDVPTNKNLLFCLSSYLKSKSKADAPWDSKNCGLFYANAIWLLKQTDGMSGAITNKRELYAASRIILEETINGLPKLRLIITLGRHAYQTLGTCVSSLSPDWRTVVRSHHIQKVVLFGRDLNVAAVLHPSPLSGGRDKASLQKDFEAVIESGLS